MKLQPNFSWQKYEGKPEDQKEQFQYQLQNQHVLVSNSVNATIDDESFWSRERRTAFTWLDGRPIYTKTISGTLVGTAVTPYAHGITGIRTVVRIQGEAQAAVPLLVDALPLPFVDPNTALNGIGLYVNTTSLVITTGNAAFNGFLFNVTIEYTKV